MTEIGISSEILRPLVLGQDPKLEKCVEEVVNSYAPGLSCVIKMFFDRKYSIVELVLSEALELALLNMYSSDGSDPNVALRLAESIRNKVLSRCGAKAQFVKQLIERTLEREDVPLRVRPNLIRLPLNKVGITFGSVRKFINGLRSQGISSVRSI